MHRYLFLLGREISLNAAEVAATGRFESFDVSASGNDVLVAQTARKLEDATAFIDRLGGTVKIAEVVAEIDGVPTVDDLLAALPTDGKVHFGISWYGGKVPNLDQLGRQLKAALQQRGQPARFVSSRENPLSSVILRTQKLLGAKGCELIVSVGLSRPTLLGRTLAAQNFIEYGRRDAGRPSRNIGRGMLPPKVAQILLNLANVQPGNTVLDPFCGTGTVLQEALVMGAARAIGRDSDPKAISETEDNLGWLKARASAPAGEWEVYQHDAREPDSRLKPGSVDAVATETYLGPLRPPRGSDLQRKLLGELSLLYKESLSQVAASLKPGGRMAVVVPVLEHGSAASSLSSIPGLQLVSVLPVALAHQFGVAAGQGLVYQRPGQTVGRAVVVLEKE